MVEDSKKLDITEEQEKSSKRKLTLDESVVESEKSQVPKQKRLSFNKEEIIEREKFESEPTVLNDEESNVSQSNDEESNISQTNEENNIIQGNSEKSNVSQGYDEESSLVQGDSDISQVNSNMITTTNGRRVTPYEPECKLCHKRFYGPRTYYEHIESPGHKRKLFKNTYECKICDKTVIGQINYELHLKGKLHKKNITLIELGEKFKPEEKESSVVNQSQSSGENSFKYNKPHCVVCNKKFSGLIPYNIHMSSPVHSNNVQKAVLEKIATCQVCNKTFSGLMAYDTHMSSSEHTRNVHNARFGGGAHSQNFFFVNNTM